MTQNNKPTLSRRSFLRTSSALGAVGAAAVALPGCGGNTSSPVTNVQPAPSTVIPPPPVAQSGTWIYEPELFRLTINLGDVTVGDGTTAGSCDYADESRTFKIRGLFHDSMFWAVPAPDGTLFLQQWVRIPDSTANGGEPTMAGIYKNSQGFILTLNNDGTTAIVMTNSCAGYGYLGHTALEHNLFRQGVAAGDPSSEGFILWTRLEPDDKRAVSVNLEISTANDFSSLVTGYTTDFAFPFTAMGSNDDDDSTHSNHVVKTVVTGLSPSTTYFYRFVTVNDNDSAGQPFTSLHGRAKTIPATTDAPPQLRTALASCSSFPHGFFNAYRQIARHDDLDGVFHLGDYTYEYPGEGGAAPGNSHDYPQDPADLVRRYSEDNREETIGLGSYRRRFRNYREDIDLQFVHARFWFINTWDDHETTNDSFDPDLAGPDGDAENHNDIDTFDEGDWEPRKAAASQAYNEWHPITDIRKTTDGYNDPRLNRTFRFGNLADLIILDTRIQGRTFVDVNTQPYANSERGNMIPADRKFMSDSQRDFMLNALTTAQNDGVQWKLLGQQVMMGHLVGPPLISTPPSNANDPDWASVINSDQWDGFDAERETIFDHIESTANPIDNFVVLTGDIHTSWAINLVDDPRKRTPITTGPVSVPAPSTKNFGVEFVTTSITSPGLSDPGALSASLETNNQHIQRVELNNRGYSILQLDANEARCTWFHIASITDQEDEGVTEAFAFKVDDGASTLDEV